MRKRESAAVIGLAIAGVSMFATGSASSHGYTDSPISRSEAVQNGSVTGCGNIQWEPQSVEGPKGFPAQVRRTARSAPAATAVRAARRPAWRQLARHQRPGGQCYSFRWQFTARHSTSDFRYYITKNGWDSTKPLTRAALESQPFMTVPYGNQQPPATLTHQGAMPTQKTGKHIVLAVWNVADTATRSTRAPT